jgi:hypothetical protein
MAARVADLPGGWGMLELRRADERRAVQRALLSYDARDRLLVWRPGRAVRGDAACDIEAYDRPVPAPFRLRGRTALEFFARWTATEVVAKVLQIPVVIWIREEGLVPCRPGRSLEYLAGERRISLWNCVLPETKVTLTLGHCVRQ